MNISFRDGTRWQTNATKQVWLMGVINLTDDSFYPGSRVGGIMAGKPTSDFLAMLENLERADIFDLGAESSRPGAEPVAAAIELQRLVPVVEWLKAHHPHKRISIDTYKSEVAEECIKRGVDMINDISAGEGSDNKMFQVAAESGVPLVLMHKQGSPKTMQDHPHYKNVVQEVYEYLEKRIALAIEHGCIREKLIVDVGIGFGKTLSHNISLLQALPTFKELGVGLLVGASRKRLVGELTGKPAEDRLPGSIGVHLAAAHHGADILRIHDVDETADALKGFLAVLPGMIGDSC